MAWYIDPQLNEGYPTNTDFIEVHSGWTDTSDVPMNKYAWRITAGVNEGYPYLGWWYEAKSGGSGADMTIGGAKSNYPGGFISHNNDSVRDALDSTDMKSYVDSNPLIDGLNNMITTSLSRKIYACTSNLIHQAIGRLNDASIVPSAERSMIQEVFGADIYKGIIMCKQYPFQLLDASASTINFSVPTIYGIYPLVDVSDTSQGLFPEMTEVTKIYDMGHFTIPATQAWEIEQIDWSIYLPYAGLHPIDIRNAGEVSVTLFIDLLSGVGEYYIFLDGQIVDIVKGSFGWDFPFDISKSQMLANMAGFAQNTVSTGLSLGSTVAGMAGNEAAAIGLGMAGGAIHSTQHYSISAPSVGGLAGICSYPLVRLIAKVPKMFRGGYAYHEILGANRSAGYDQLSSHSGFIKCKNYKCDIIVATSDEKAEIERLMDSGVFV